MVSIFMILLLVLGGATAAQDMMDFAYCGDLPEADCDLLKAAQEASSTLTSGTTQMEMNLSVSNIPDAPFDELAFTLAGDGTFAIDPDLMETMTALQANPAQFADPMASMEMMGDLLGGFAGDLNLTLTIPPALAAMASGATDQSIPEELSVSLRLVDGFGYVNLDSVAAALPPDAGIPAGWLGIDLVAAMDLVMGQMGALGDMDMMDTEAMESYMSAFQDPDVFAEFLAVERLDDVDVMGQAAAVFRMTFDYGAFFRSELFTSMMQAQMDMMASMGGGDISSEEMDEVMAMLAPMFDNINLVILETIGLDDNYVHIVDVNLDWDMADFMMAIDPEAEGPAPVIAFDMSVQNGNFNDALTITAPEDATIFPIEAMLSSDM